MKVRLDDPERAVEFVHYFRERGFLVVRRNARDVDLHLLNHVSNRYDRLEARRLMTKWRELYPKTTLEETDS